MLFDPQQNLLLSACSKWIHDSRYQVNRSERFFHTNTIQTISKKIIIIQFPAFLRNLSASSDQRIVQGYSIRGIELNVPKVHYLLLRLKEMAIEEEIKADSFIGLYIEHM